MKKYLSKIPDKTKAVVLISSVPVLFAFVAYILSGQFWLFIVTLMFLIVWAIINGTVIYETYED